MEKGNASFAHEVIMVLENKTYVCHDPHNYRTNLWRSGNPLNSPTSLLVLQLILISFASHLIDFFLKPLGQSSIVSHILGGVVFGPSALGHQNLLGSRLFPTRGTVVIETTSSFGLMFFFFIVGTKMDAATMLRLDRKSVILGLSVFIFTLGLPTGLAMIMRTYVSMEKRVSHALVYIAASQSLTTFPVIACLLTDLKIINTDIGRLALSSAMVIDIVGIALTAVAFSMMQNRSHNVLPSLWTISTSIGLLLGILYILRPAILWMLNRSKEQNFVKESYICTIFLFVLLTGYFSEIIGQHFVFGPLILGLVVPDGPPLGSTLVYKLDTFVTGFFYPTYLAVSGIQTNIFKIDLQAMWIVGTLIVFSCIVRIAAVMLPARLATDMPYTDSFVLALILSAKGIVELVVYNLWRGTKVLADEEFALLVLSVIVITAIIAPLISYFYDPSKLYRSTKKSSIQHAQREGVLRIMICIPNKENVPTMVNLLEVSHASFESTIAVTALIVKDLVGRTRPILVAHQPHTSFKTEECTSTPIINALRQYELNNEGCATLQSFSSTSHYATMHEDVCRIAVDCKANIIIVPFFKQWAIDGNVESMNRGIQTMYMNVLEKAPCSVAILIDRGNLSGTGTLLTGESVYNIAVIFIGGADDSEALAYGDRMAKHECVQLTVVRFLHFGSENCKERRRDTDLIDEYRRANIGNERFMIVDEVIRDGVGLTSSIRDMIEGYNLMLVGRHHPDSPLLMGLDRWSECPELGVVGDMLASTDDGITTSILVVQQQRIGGNWINHTKLVVSKERDRLLSDVRQDQVQRSYSWTISMNKYDIM